MTLGRPLRCLLVVCSAIIQLCHGTCYWSKPVVSSSATAASRSATFNGLSKRDKISYLAGRLESLGSSDDDDDDDDSGEHCGDSREELEYRDGQSARTLQKFVRSRALSKKVQKQSEKKTRMNRARSGWSRTGSLIGHHDKSSGSPSTAAAAAASVRWSAATEKPSRRTVTTWASGGFETTGVPVAGGNVLLSVPSGYVANSVTTTTTRLLTDEEAVRSGLFSDGRTSSSSYGQSGASSGIDSRRTVDSGSSISLGNRYRRPGWKSSASVNVGRLDVARQSINAERSAGYGERLNRRAGAPVAPTSGGQVGGKNGRLNVVVPGEPAAGGESRSKHVIGKIGTAAKIDGTFESSTGESIDFPKSHETADGDNNDANGGDDDNAAESNYAAHGTRRDRSVQSRSTKEIRTTATVRDVRKNNIQNSSGSNENTRSVRKRTVDVSHKTSARGAFSDESAEADGRAGETNRKSNENYDLDEDDSVQVQDEPEDETSVYEHSDTFREFRFDKGLNVVGIIGEVLTRLDYQRHRLMDDITYPRDSTRYVADDDEFDFIVVGAGNAGCVLANKLSENVDWNVLLVEAGGDPFPVTQVPALWHRSLGSAADWQYSVEPDGTTGFGISGNMKLHKGKCLGGSSTTSPQLYVRGSEKMYDSLVKKGLTNWSYNTTETYFKKVERVRTVTRTETNTTIIYGDSGLIPVSQFRKTEVSILEKVICSGFEHIGCKRARDINDKDIEVGFVSMQGTIKNGRTFNTAKAYLSPTFGRENLKVLKHATVTKVLIDNADATATGIEVQTRFGQVLTVRARMEVVLSAGAVGSAKILLASGVGPKKHLSEMDVPVVKDSRVGSEFLIAPVFTGLVISYDKAIVNDQTEDEIAFKYLARHSGLLSTPKGMNFGGFLNTGTSGSQFADVEVHQFYIRKRSFSKLCELKAMYGFSDDVLSAYAKLNDERDISIFTIALVNPKSTGSILLRNKNPFENPIVVANMLSDETDVKTLLEAVRLLSDIENSGAMKLLDATLETVDIDGCAKYQAKTEDHWKCLLKYTVSTTSSTAGSCRMGLKTDPKAVVDEELNVIGVSNLRVVGRSVLPMITSAYSHIPCIVIAERAADMIQSKYRIKS